MQNADKHKSDVGNLLCGGFLGTSVTPQAYHLIVDNRVSTIILTRKNALSVRQITKLIQDLQYIACFEAKYKYPLMFAIDQEGGMMNALFDPEYITQFPGAMALAATGDTDLVYKILKALAIELREIGFLIILGPVLDVVTKLSHQLVGVRSFGTTIEEVSKYGKACARGLADGGLITVGKHFPGIGNAGVDSLLELPMMMESIDQIRSYNCLPFFELIKEHLLDGISVAGCGVPSINPDETHACLSPILINKLLRQELGFDGFVISECLEMDALYHSIGVGQGVILAVHAGCDLVMLCHQKPLQDEALESLNLALSNGNLDFETINIALKRIEKIQKKLPGWDKVFPNGEQSAKLERAIFKEKEPELWQQHQELSKTAYQKSITLVRDYSNVLPITRLLSNELDSTNGDDSNNILILSPLLAPVYPSSNITESPLFSGEETFQRFGQIIADHPKNINSKNPFNVLHTSYTANGLTALHESLIESSRAVIVLTSEASRNMYQIGIVKFVSVLCGGGANAVNSRGSYPQLTKPLIIIATLSPYDFFYNKSIGSAYLCCYDYSENVLQQLAGVLMGDIILEGCIPGEKKFLNKLKKRKNAEGSGGAGDIGSFNQKRAAQPRRRWLVDEFNLTRDWKGLMGLLKSDNPSDNRHFMRDFSSRIDCNSTEFYKKLYLLLHTSSQSQKHFVVRNSSLNILYGFIFTWVDEFQDVPLDGNLVEVDNQVSKNKTGSILYILVDKSKRFLNIGKNLHARAIRYLVKERGCTKLALGGSFPLILLPSDSGLLNKQTKVTSFMNSVGWEMTSLGKKRHVMLLDDLSNWLVPEKMFRELTIVGVRFDICTDPEKLMNLIRQNGLDTPINSDYHAEHVNTKRIYLEAVKYLAGNQVTGVKIITALEPTNQTIIGSIILFTNKSSLSKFFPFMDEGLKADDRLKDNNEQHLEMLVGGLIGLIIDTSYSNLIEIINVGLVCSGITFLKSNFNDKDSIEMDRCMIFGVNDAKSENFSGLKDIGFREWKYYYDHYDVIDDLRTIT